MPEEAGGSVPEGRVPACQFGCTPLTLGSGFKDLGLYACRVPFVIALLRHGLGVAENQTRIGTGREAWTLGAALAEGSKVGAGRGPTQRLLSRSTTVTLCSGTFLLWTLFLAWTWWCTVRPP